MTDARLAYSLETLRDEVNARWPARDKASDGWIGNADHQATPSDHNPNEAGVVCALDITNDPGSGADMGKLAELLRVNRHPDLKYVIVHWDRRMFSAYEAHGVPAFTWRDYHGAAATELHVSVGVGRDGQSVEPYDDRDSWFSPSVPAPGVDPTQEEDDMTGRAIAYHQGHTYAFKRGDDGQVWYSLDGAGFENAIPNGRIGSAPSIAFAPNGQLVVCGKGADDDKTWCVALDGQKWSDWFTL